MHELLADVQDALRHRDPGGRGEQVDRPLEPAPRREDEAAGDHDDALGAVVFVVGSVLDILDGALARVGGKSTPFGAFIDSTTDRVGEGAMLAAIALVFSRHGKDWAVVVAVAAVVGSFLVSYTRARAEALGLSGTVGLGSRAERVVVITAGLVFAPWGGLPWAIVVLAATAWLTVVQRILHVRKQLLHGGTNVDQR
jgi:CDP-diacylglycerol--glycerol-3-phosphate 3-phosphatidyltransferase